METRIILNNQQSVKIKMVKKGFIAALPIILGYLPIAITYGVLASQSGISLFELTAMSILVYAGAAQFMGVNMITVGAGSIEIIVATFVLNFRHFVMSLSFANRTRPLEKKWKIPLSLGLTDESFSVASLNTKEGNQEAGGYFYGTLMVTAYASWIVGSFLGGVLGDVIPETLSRSMGIALYAMFIALLIPSVKKEIRFGYIAIVAMVLNYVFSYQWALAQGWSIVCSTLLASFIGTFMIKGRSF
ncbi:Inner membrane protein YgaZ [Paraliobacillus sp. PM-2]|uniref:AzlC family ABC transporter permease n=1 Tax=Paraliobacillus sp. PM-2 TaxID=1462524 RepID=UPI00061C6722|nr:AzlC family ABC transporter permease [Paraliobacillus sp. PM-2]CQR47067.1 Inner membrane protein YgaZ [Paraliobacillus sp. PM-2]